MNKLIWQICRFYLDGKFNWEILDYDEQEYLKSIYTTFNLQKCKELYYKVGSNHHTGQQEYSNLVADEIKKLVPFFFEPKAG